MQTNPTGKHDASSGGDGYHHVKVSIAVRWSIWNRSTDYAFLWTYLFSDSDWLWWARGDFRRRTHNLQGTLPGITLQVHCEGGGWHDPSRQGNPRWFWIFRIRGAWFSQSEFVGRERSQILFNPLKGVHVGSSAPNGEYPKEGELWLIGYEVKLGKGHFNLLISCALFWLAGFCPRWKQCACHGVQVGLKWPWPTVPLNMKASAVTTVSHLRFGLWLDPYCARDHSWKSSLTAASPASSFIPNIRISLPLDSSMGTLGWSTWTGETNYQLNWTVDSWTLRIRVNWSLLSDCICWQVY